MSARILWTFFALFVLCFLGPALHLAQIGQSKSPASPFARQHWSKFATAIALPLLVAELLAIVATRTAPGHNIVAEIVSAIAKLGAAVFPLVGKFATEMDPPLPPGLLIQAQAVFTVFLLASFIAAAGVALLVFLLRPSPPSNDIWERPRSLDLSDLIGPLFAVMLVASLFGWSDFYKNGLNLRGSGIFNAYQYLLSDNDLQLIGAAFARFLTVLLIPFVLAFWWLRLRALYAPSRAKD